ncbi:hypothetical protein [Bradyrhizobium sp. ARR65]|uniref:hypothetical protein n=1 Tax=Bradyrhizobium sp. ARR65 TaxID=1040989 RepID=UPI000AE757B0|nr:hypothetical protein [Bradyrhizobium sp. ARR65]
MVELFEPAVPIATAALLARSSVHAWRAKNPWLKWGGASLAALLAAILVALGVVLILDCSSYMRAARRP